MKALSAIIILLSAAVATPAIAAVITVNITNIAFSPATVAAHAGDTIEWKNNDFIAHTATADNDAWNVVLQPHKTGRVVLKKAGKISYHCTYHPNMKGEIDVK